MKRTFDDQCNNIQQVLDDAKAVGVGEKMFAVIQDFLEDYWGMTKVYPFKFQQLNKLAGVRWEIPNGYCSVLFDPDNDRWSYEAKFTKPDDDKYYPGMITSFSYSGQPSFYITQVDKTEKPYYVLPTEIDNFLKLEDEFSKQYEPIIPAKEVRFVWITNRYDGPISGYVEYRQSLYFADMVEETNFERNRIFALYKISTLEKLVALFKLGKWNLVRRYAILWKMHYMNYNRKMRNASKKNINEKIKEAEEKKKEFQNNHTIIGYAVNIS